MITNFKNRVLGLRGMTISGKRSLHLVTLDSSRAPLVKATSHSAILCACVDRAIKDTDDVLPAKDSPHCTSL